MGARAYIERSITEPGAHVVEGFDDLMPRSLAKTLSQEEIDALIAYLFTLE